MNYKGPQKFDPPVDKFCHSCSDTKKIEEFYKNRARVDGYSQYCRVCTRERLEDYNRNTKFRANKVRKRKIDPSKLILENQPETIRKMVMLLAEDGKLTCAEIAARLEMSPLTIRNYMYQNEFLRALKGMGSRAMTQMLPQAVEAFRESLNAKSEDVRLKAATKLLESEQALGPTRVDVSVNDLSQKSNAELEAIIANIPSVPSPTLEAEVIS